MAAENKLTDTIIGMLIWMACFAVATFLAAVWKLPYSYGFWAAVIVSGAIELGRAYIKKRRQKDLDT